MCNFTGNDYEKDFVLHRNHIANVGNMLMPERALRAGGKRALRHALRKPASPPSDMQASSTGNVFPCVAVPATIGEVARMRAEGVGRQPQSGFSASWETEKFVRL